MNAVTVIARAFCDHYPRLTSEASYPCKTCVGLAKNALHELAGQGVLFDQPKTDAPLSDPDLNSLGIAARQAKDTSVAARFAVMPKTGNQRHRVLWAIVDAWFKDGYQGLTDDELMERLGMTHQSCGPRRGELVSGGWIEDSGERRNTRAGNPAIVWKVSRAGIARVNGIKEPAA